MHRYRRRDQKAIARSKSSPLSSRVRRANTGVGLVEPYRRIPARDGKEAEAYRTRRGLVRAAPDALGISGSRYRARATTGVTSTNPIAYGYHGKPARGST